MPFPFIAAAIAAAGVGSAIAGASSAKSAARTAERTAAENNRLAQQNRQQNIGLLQPTVNRGNAAGERLNALLGLGGGGSAGGFEADRYLQENPDVAAGFYQQDRFATPQEYADFHYNTYGRNEGRAVPQAQSGQSGQAAANEAFDAFRDSTGYQFRVGEGERGINAGFAGRGMLQSGAAMKEIERFRQGIASQEFGNYTGLLDNQQRIGANGLNALVGNNNSTTNALMGNNDSAGQARGNAQLATGAAIGNGLNSLVGAFGYGRGSSYGSGNKLTFNAPFKVPSMTIPQFPAPRFGG